MACPHAWDRTSSVTAAVLDAVERYSSAKELGGFNASPQDALLAIFLENAQAFYAELQIMTRRFLDYHNLNLADDLLDELVDYQQLRMTIWQPATTHRRDLSYDLPTFFDHLSHIHSDALPQEKVTKIEVTVPESDTLDRFVHARKRTHGARYTDVLAVRVV